MHSHYTTTHTHTCFSALKLTLKNFHRHRGLHPSGLCTFYSKSLAVSRGIHRDMWVAFRYPRGETDSQLKGKYEQLYLHGQLIQKMSCLQTFQTLMSRFLKHYLNSTIPRVLADFTIYNNINYFVMHTHENPTICQSLIKLKYSETIMRLLFTAWANYSL